MFPFPSSIFCIILSAKYGSSHTNRSTISFVCSNAVARACFYGISTDVKALTLQRCLHCAECIDIVYRQSVTKILGLAKHTSQRAPSPSRALRGGWRGLSVFCCPPQTRSWENMEQITSALPSSVSPALTFEVTATQGRARASRMTLPHFVAETPMFMPVGTKGTEAETLAWHLEYCNVRCAGLGGAAGQYEGFLML